MDTQLPKRAFNFYSKEPFSVRLLLALCSSFLVAATGRSLRHGLLRIFIHWNYLVDFIVCTLMIVLTLEMTYRISRLLDGRYDWPQKLFKRTLLQYYIGFFFPVFILDHMNSLYILEGGHDLLRVNFAVFQVPASYFVVGAYNLFCFGSSVLEQLLNLQHKPEVLLQLQPGAANMEEANAETTAPATLAPIDIWIIAGNEQKLLSQLHTLLIIQKNKVNNIYVLEGHPEESDSKTGTVIKKYINYTHPLSDFYNVLDHGTFFKTNRTTIINREIVLGLGPNADPNPILVNVGIDEEVTVSGRQRTAFTEWLGNNGQRSKPPYTRVLSQLLV